MRTPRRSLTRSIHRAGSYVCASSLLLALNASFPLQGNEARRSTLSFEERVEAHRAVEEVVWRHRLWPEDNPGPKPPLSAVLGDQMLREKVRDVLRKSRALETLWNRPITSEQLQAEIDRMTAATRDPQMLREMFHALRDDPFLVAEIVARPILADRLLRSSYAADEAIHGMTRARAQAAVAGNPDLEVLRRLADRYEEKTFVLEDTPSAVARGSGPGVRLLRNGDWDEYVRWLGDRLLHAPGTVEFSDNSTLESILSSLPVNRASDLVQDEQGLSAVILLEKAPGLLRLGTASWILMPFDAWWMQVRPATPASIDAAPGPFVVPDSGPLPPSCTNDTWVPTGGAPPLARLDDSMVWTGAEVIVWGGEFFGGSFTNTGGRYDPATATWTPTSLVGTPVGRSVHTAIWTGTQMIVWGGTDPGSGGTGGRYDPAGNNWSPTSTTGVTGRGGHSAVWTGSLMIIWGGVGLMGIPIASGARYDPSTDTWSAMPDAPLDGRWLHSTVWTGSEMIVYGGRDAPGPAPAFYDGARYNPTTNSWVYFVPPILGRTSATAVWDGSSMILWGGDNNHGIVYGDGGRLSPSSGSWTPLPSQNAPAARTLHTAVWTGSEMIVWGGWLGIGMPLTTTGGRYRPDINAWVATSTASAPSARTYHHAVWASTRMITWGGNDGSSGYFDTGGVYCACRDWSVDADGDGWGNASTPTTTCDGTHPPGLGAPGDCNDANPAFHPGAFDGNCNGVDEDCDLAPDDGYVPPPSSCGVGVCARSGLINCSGGTLVNSCVPGAPEEGSDVTCDGRDGDCDGATDENFAPTTDHWTPLPPSPEAGTRVPGVWTGTQLLLWNGNQSVPFGQRYTPGTNSWDQFDETLGLAPRHGHSAVWTGSSMIVWGGDDTFQWFADGGDFEPGSADWLPVDSTGAPAGRSGHTAVWTDSLMIVWGGTDGTSFLRSGGAYEPTSPFWTATRITGAPTVRTGHTAVWTGTRMIVWGGLGGTPGSPVPLATGSLYNPVSDTWIATSTTGASSARSAHTALWTGTQMIVWGGTGASGPLGDGARYDPSANAWTAVSSAGAPSARSGHVAIWNGTEMIVWGGVGVSGPLANGARYNPATNSWSPMTGTAAPGARGSAAAVWTGSEMIVWGGENGGALASGGRYNSTLVTCGIGPCQSTGQTFCSAGAPGFACTPGTPSPEICDGIDNDCNSVVDDNVPVPGGLSSLSSAGDPSLGYTLSWTPIPNASFYDMVLGSLPALKATAGDFSASTSGCLLNDYPTTSVNLGNPPQAIGDGLWFLVRGANTCSGSGTYDGPGAMQVGARDAEIAFSGVNCP